MGVLLLECLGQTPAAVEGTGRCTNSHALWMILTREWYLTQVNLTPSSEPLLSFPWFLLTPPPFLEMFSRNS